MKNNDNITGKQVLADCLTLCKHLGAYAVCVTRRIFGKLKSLLADKDKTKDANVETETAASGNAAA